MLHALAFGTGVVVAVALQEIDDAPGTEARAQRDNKDFKSVDCRSKKCHIRFSSLKWLVVGGRGCKQPRSGTKKAPPAVLGGANGRGCISASCECRAPRGSAGFHGQDLLFSLFWDGDGV